MTHALKFFIGFVVCFALRLFPWRPPNVEPILATAMPFSKYFGWFGGFLFPALSILLFDMFTAGISEWTWITMFTYGFIGAIAGPILKNRRGPLPYVLFAIPATLFYDAMTGVVLGSLLFDLPWKQGLIGQIPFTVNHLIGNIILATVLSPLIERWVTANPKLHRVSLARA